ncbi:hypothetical protein EGT36_23230 [Agrobacterium sp. FDAARGOS_525]|jgi:hypothetical protein|uniref:hypothetical protein n=1 Tax=Agrobacterium sp. FDAARGOS_525 TaxID=2420311 RepID=UPI000F65A88A|nr:hypothetical protein [Agrobacterium sp. FDAARGOS_525]RSC31533.1 hypothetical protein EGT36_23230 [Agrobacterium sp. FDAARGOS_525]
MREDIHDTAWKLGVQELLRRLIADTHFSSDKQQFQKQLDGLLSQTLTAIEANVGFYGVSDADVAEIKDGASKTVKTIVGTIKPI